MSKEASLKGYDKETEAISKYEHYSVGFHNTFGDIRSLHVRLTSLIVIGNGGSEDEEEKYAIMDWVSYGAQKRREGKLEGMREGARDQLEQDVRGLYAEGIMPDVISRITKTSIDTVKEILGLQSA